jgi:hypothetical protein
MNEQSRKQDEPGGFMDRVRTLVSHFGEKRRMLQKTLRNNSTVSLFLKMFVCVVMFLDIILMVYALLAVTYRASSLGVSLVDSLPLAFYALPLLVFLPSMLKAYYDSRMGIVPLFIFIIAGLVLLLIASVQPLFYLVSALNIMAILVVILDGRFHPQSSIRSLGKRTVVYLLVLNMIGLVFPASVYVMGQTPIAAISFEELPNLYLTVPTAAVEYVSENIPPDSHLLDEIQDAGFGIDIQYLAMNNNSVDLVTDWLTEASNRSLPLRVTVHSNRSALLSEDLSIANQLALSEVYSVLEDGTQELCDIIQNLGIEQSSIEIQVDLRLSPCEWGALLEPMRALNLAGFSGLVEEAIRGIDHSSLDAQYESLHEVVDSAGLSLGLLVDAFVIDDLQDDDPTLMLTNGVTPAVIKDADFVEIDIQRSKFSLEMDGDVGKYLVHSYSQSARVLSDIGIKCSCRLGIVGEVEFLDGRDNPVYQTSDTIASDVAVCAGHGLSSLTITSLESLLRTEGGLSVNQLKTRILDAGTQTVTYTFRIYAFRAVVFAIDSFRIM